MSNVIGYIEQLKIALSAEISSVSRELSFLPKGRLLLRKSKGYICYIHVVNGKEHGISKNWSLICKLARKRYLKERLKLLCGNLTAVENFYSSYSNLNPETIISKLPKTFQVLPTNTFFPDYNQNWSNLSFKKNPFRFYMVNHLVPWDNLICTYEKDTRDGRRIQQLIKNMLL
jgi:hypothetical protein